MNRQHSFGVWRLLVAPLCCWAVLVFFTSNLNANDLLSALSLLLWAVGGLVVVCLFSPSRIRSIVRSQQRMRRRRLGLCVACGYDLRPRLGPVQSAGRRPAVRDLLWVSLDACRVRNEELR
jgi:hypothetical protein